jgi:hypothetical protein
VADQLWVVRAGERARFIDDFQQGGFVAVGFEEFHAADLNRDTEHVLRAKATTPAERIFASQLSAFAYKIQVDDVIIVPQLPKKRAYLVGRVTGPYNHVTASSPSGPHRRPVRWEGEFTREGLSEGAVNTLGAIQTVFRPTVVEAELRALLTDLSPTSADTIQPGRTERGAPSLQHTSKETPGLASVQLDIEVDGAGRAKIICSHPALTMEQTPRHADPVKDWGGAPGIYVLTGTTLEHAAVRTGNERTLTTTLIVRPWAYVGLSEDFLGRLSSHRQTKPEWRRALLVRSSAVPFNSDDLKYLERKVYNTLDATAEVQLAQAIPRGNISAHPRNTDLLNACADTVVAVLRLTGTLI